MLRGVYIDTVGLPYHLFANFSVYAKNLQIYCEYFETKFGLLFILSLFRMWQKSDVKLIG